MADFIFLLQNVVSGLLLPPLAPALIVLLGLMLRRRWVGAGLIATGLVSVVLLSTNAVSSALLVSLQVSQALSPTNLPRAGAIVVLAGGLREQAAEYGSDQPNIFTLERLRYGAWLAKRTGLPLLVTGGYKYDGPTEAQVMAQTLRDEFGLQPRWVESRSRDTSDNASYSAELLREAKIARVLLVTHAWHMRRALLEFKAAHLDPVPAPTVFARVPNKLTFVDFLPTARAYFNSGFALHEWLGIAWASLRGR
ncbi:MAG: YdcF family protein [Betaproteobacteria bacterium]|nr:YdcF family protein [Betaproteobacteria bacterium]